jgi:hypothetical protein
VIDRPLNSGHKAHPMKNPVLVLVVREAYDIAIQDFLKDLDEQLNAAGMWWSRGSLGR